MGVKYIIPIGITFGALAPKIRRQLQEQGIRVTAARVGLSRAGRCNRGAVRGWPTDGRRAPSRAASARESDREGGFVVSSYPRDERDAADLEQSRRDMIETDKKHDAAFRNRAFTGRHSMDSPEWFTPPEIVGPAFATLVGIDLDPASHEEANVYIRAKRIYTAETNGLIRPWTGKVFLNPPGGLVADFWKKLLEELPRIEAAIWIGYSLEQLQTLQRIGAPKTPLDFPMCVPNRRISFIESKAKEAERVKKIRQVNAERAAHGLKLKSEKKGGPSHANYITYIGQWTEDFASAFEPVGQVTIPR